MFFIVCTSSDDDCLIGMGSILLGNCVTRYLCPSAQFMSVLLLLFFFYCNLPCAFKRNISEYFQRTVSHETTVKEHGQAKIQHFISLAYTCYVKPNTNWTAKHHLLLCHTRKWYWGQVHMTSLKIDMHNPALVCGPMKFLLIKPRNRIWTWPLTECSQILR